MVCQAKTKNEPQGKFLEPCLAGLPVTCTEVVLYAVIIKKSRSGLKWLDAPWRSVVEFPASEEKRRVQHLLIFAILSHALKVFPTLGPRHINKIKNKAGRPTV